MEKYPKSDPDGDILEKKLFDRMGNQREFKALLENVEIGKNRGNL